MARHVLHASLDCAGTSRRRLLAHAVKRGHLDSRHPSRLPLHAGRVRPFPSGQPSGTSDWTC
eukprot:5162136-Prymnesium_polylepis.1